MDDIDELIQKYGVEDLLAKIMQRRDYAASLAKKSKKGRPATEFTQLWDLQYLYSIFKSRFPHENQKYIADRLLSFVKQYRVWEKRPDLYEEELKLNHNLYSNVSWLAEDLDPKTIENKIGVLNSEKKKAVERMAKAKFNKLEFPIFENVEFPIFPDDWKDGDDLSDY